MRSYDKIDCILSPNSVSFGRLLISKVITQHFIAKIFSFFSCLYNYKFGESP